MTAAKKRQLLSDEDYLAAERAAKTKHEYLGGYVYAMAGARTQHNRVAVAFVSAMHTKLRGRPCEAFNFDMKVRIRSAHTRFYYPDGLVVCEPNPGVDEFQDRPVVIAEVLSPSTCRTDEGEKREAYLSIPTLAAYLLIETELPRVVVHRRTPAGFVTDTYEGLDAKVSLESIGTDFSLAELYERSDFAVAAREAREEAVECGLPDDE